MSTYICVHRIAILIFVANFSSPVVLFIPRNGYLSAEGNAGYASKPVPVPATLALIMRTLSIGLQVRRTSTNRLETGELNHRNGSALPVIRVSAYEAKTLHHTHTTRNPSKNSMLSVEMRAGRERDEELRPVGVWTRIRHRDDACTCKNVRCRLSRTRIELSQIVGCGESTPVCLSSRVSSSANLPP